MRIFFLSLALTCIALLSVACGSSEQSKSSAGGAEAMPTATVRTPTQPAQTNPVQTNDAPPVAVAHGAPQGNNQPSVPSSHGTPPAMQSPPGGASATDTAALDKKVERAEAKAKAPRATEADKHAASAAYLERANVFYSAGNPSLYKFALRDFRRALRYDAGNEEARAKEQQIVEIYQSMGRPVPDLGNEP